ncbi:MAG: hypothetical protein ACREJC_02755 [Tepidisphaeraceae bacterium]
MGDASSRLKRRANAPIKVEERAQVPVVWLVVVGLVIVGLIVNIFMVGGLVIWPFVFAVATLLIVNDAANRNAVGVPPIQAYGLFCAVFLAFFLFVALVSTINPWLVVMFALAVGVFLVRDWKRRRDRQRDIARRRMSGCCVRCDSPVGSGIEEVCENCGLPVNPDRLSLFNLGRMIETRARGANARQVLTGGKPSRSDLKMQKLQARDARRHGRPKQ